MSLGLAEARQRLAYINQYRELALLVLFAAGLCLRIVDASLSWLSVVLLGVWAVLAWSFVTISNQAQTESSLQWIEISYFGLELALITALAVASHMPEWIILLLYLVTLLYSTMVLPRPAALGATALAAISFTGLVVWQPEPSGRHPLLDLVAKSGHPALLLGAGALAGFALIGFSLSQFAFMLHRQGEALQAANLDLNDTSRELRRHRDHLEDMVADRTRELEQANAELMRLNELKSSFLANVSHELRTPLTSIRSFSEILLRYPDEEEGTRSEFLEIIIKETDRLTRLINDVLDLAKIEAGRLEIRMQPVCLEAVVVPALELMQMAAAAKGIRLLNLLPAMLPAVSADPDRLRQVVTNLFSNALKFTEDGTISVGAERKGSEVIVYVADTGAGIPAADLNRVFEKFHQGGDTMTAKPEGSGLGLSICRELVERMGGRIWAEPRQPRGSVFCCALPVAEIAVAAAAGATAQSVGSS